jgi:hypothetical protein
MATNSSIPEGTTIERRLISLRDDIRAAEHDTGDLDDDTASDVLSELLTCSKAIQNALDLLDALPAFSSLDADRRSA